MPARRVAKRKKRVDMFTYSPYLSTMNLGRFRRMLSMYVWGSCLFNVVSWDAVFNHEVIEPSGGILIEDPCYPQAWYSSIFHLSNINLFAFGSKLSLGAFLCTAKSGKIKQWHRTIYNQLEHTVLPNYAASTMFFWVVTKPHMVRMDIIAMEVRVLRKWAR